ncbi:DSD1 family PLP-dependent enzyme [Aquincola tertiaricarbonis]|uniref:DSD1 family PLP-dependent enzyme n=1 Tax=Aquincola tertiaricarbonis TaxID=391953 RepID=UPI0006151073|nr:DSD1 family PLP-dependent enzyme [Aquincola tertiaricarbonis]
MTREVPFTPVTPPPAAVGDVLAHIDTPALLIDLDAMEANMALVHQRARQAGVRVRPHGKAHKTPALALRQIAAGAQGLCCQKLGEAEAFAAAGIDDILVTNQLIGAGKARRAAALAGRIRLAVCADHPLQVQQLAEATAAAGTCLDVLVELDVGQGRCGVTSAAGAVALAQAIAGQAPGLRFAGLHAYHGSAQHLRSPAERQAAIGGAVARAREAAQALAAAGLPCATLTGGGTGTYAIEATSGVYTEVQPGSYVLMDTDYAANTPDEGTPALSHALYGWCSVISLRPGQAVLDGGLKAFATDHGLPQVLHEGWRVDGISDEHTVIVGSPGAAPLAVGDKLRLVPGHCDPTVNLHDWMVAVRAGVVEQVWPVSARGAMF